MFLLFLQLHIKNWNIKLFLNWVWDNLVFFWSCKQVGVFCSTVNASGLIWTVKQYFGEQKKGPLAFDDSALRDNLKHDMNHGKRT